MQSIPKSIHHTIPTLACLALAGTLAACGGGGTLNSNGGSDNKPTIALAKTSAEDLTQTYTRVFPGGTFDATATAAMGDSISYSSADTDKADTDKATVDVATGTVTAGKNTGDVPIYTTYSGSGNHKPVPETSSASYNRDISNAVPTITFTTATASATYAGANPGGTYTQVANVSVNTNSQCTTPPTPAYSISPENNPSATVHPDTGTVTYRAAGGTYTIEAVTPDVTSVGSTCYSTRSAYTLTINKAPSRIGYWAKDGGFKFVGSGGGKHQLKFFPYNRTTDPNTIAAMGGTISYTSANEAMATVDASGTVTAVYSGTNQATVFITTTYSGSNNYTGFTYRFKMYIGRWWPTIGFNGLDNGRTHTVTYNGAANDIESITANVAARGYCTPAPQPVYSGAGGGVTVDRDSGKVTYKAAGSYTITASTPLAPGCRPASAAYTLNVAKANATLTFDNPTDRVGAGRGKVQNLVSLGNTTGDPTTIAAMGGTISYYSDNTSIATVDANTGEVTALYRGATAVTVVIYASYTGSNNYNGITGSATTKPHYTLSIGRDPLAISFNGLSNSPTSHDVTYGGVRGVEITSITTVVSGVDANGFCTTEPPIAYFGTDTSSFFDDKITFSYITPSALTYTAAGTYLIGAVTSTPPGCGRASNLYILNVAKANPVFSFASTTTSMLPGETKPFPVNLTGVGGDSSADVGGTVSYSSANTALASVDANTGVVTAQSDDATSLVITAAYTSSSSNYNDATASYILGIGRETPTLAFNIFNPVGTNGTTSVTYAGRQGADFTNGATVTGAGLCSGTYLPGITYSSDNTTNAPVNTSGVVTYKAAGSYTITAKTDTNNRCAQASASYDLTVNKADATLTFDNPTTTVTIGATITNLARLTGVGGDSSGDDGGTLDGISISYSSADTALASVDATTGEVTAITVDVTSLVITATYSGSANYNAASGEYSLGVTLAPVEADLSADGSPIKKLIFSWQDVSDAAYYKLSKVDPDGGLNTQVGEDVTASNTGGVQSITRIVPLFASAGTRYMLESCDSANTCTPSANNQTITQAQLNRAIGYIKASNTDVLDGFGRSVSLSADGTTLAVGAIWEDSNATGVGNDQSEWSSMNNNSAHNTGAVYVFTRDTTTDDWSQQAYIKASNTDSEDRFGESLSLSADGTTLAVGASGEDSDATGVGNDQSEWSTMDNNNTDRAGAVYVFTRTSSTSRDWSQQAYIKASNTDGSDWWFGDQFGYSLSLSADGTTLAVGAYGEDSDATGVGNSKARWDEMNNNRAWKSGAVYVFTRTSSTSRDWSQQAYIKASNTGGSDWWFGDQFGYSLSLSADGTTLAVGANQETSDATGVGNSKARWDEMNNNGAWKSGAVYVFSRDTSGAWSQQAYIKASNTSDRDYFGWSVSLSADGTTLAVGAMLEGDTEAVYVFTRNTTTNNWSQQAYIKASNTDGGDAFGRSISLDANGTTLAVGAIWETSNATGVDGNQSNNNASTAGAVYVFTRTSSTSRDWSQRAYIKASNTGVNDEFGYSLSLDASGDTLAVGAPGEGSNATGIGGNQSNNGAFDSGAVYLY